MFRGILLCWLAVAAMALHAESCEQQGELLLMRLSLQTEAGQNDFNAGESVNRVVWPDVSARFDGRQICVKQEDIAPQWVDFRLPSGTATGIYVLPASDWRLTWNEQAGKLVHQVSMALYAAGEALAWQGEALQPSCVIQQLQFSEADKLVGYAENLHTATTPALAECTGSQTLFTDIWPAAKAGNHNLWRLKAEFVVPEAAKGMKGLMRKLFEKQDLDSDAKRRLKKI